MISGNYAEAQRLLTDNIVMTPEISDMLNDCELGLEYQKINTRTYLHDRLSAAVPEKMAELDRLASSLSQKYSGFGAQDAGMRMFLPLLCLISMVGFVIAVLINNSDMIVMFPMTASIAGGILFYRYYRIMAGPAANAFMLILRFWVAEMIAMITMMLPYGILGKMGIFGKLLGGLVSVGIYGFLFLFGYHDYEESKKAGSNKAEDYYRSVIKPEEDKLAAEYQRKYQVLADKYAPLKKLSSAASEYYAEEGNEGAKTIFTDLDIRTHDEIEDLSVAMKQMETDMNEYIHNLTAITAEKERIGAELNVATQIQADMLPRIFPPFPDRKEFDIFASMSPAKEVGGDFYDFFLIDDDHLGLVMADVSGKGVPAALFMVITKTLIKNRAQMGGGPAEILRYVNEQLCEGNDAELFVTVWFAILEISTGKGKAANAGHEHPVLCRANGSYDLVKYTHSPAVAVMEGIPFKEHSFELHPGDTLFVYTDGVTEATNADNQLFGTDRMLEALNKEPEASPQRLLRNVRNGINRFVGSAPQFDDITMLSLRYFGSEEAQNG